MRPAAGRAGLQPVLRTVLVALGTLAVVLLAWQLIAWSAPPRIAKGPVEVWSHLFVDSPTSAVTAAEFRERLFGLLGTTLADAGLGFIVGMVVALGLAIVFSLSRSVEAGVMPLALFLRAVPIVALAPIIVLITGSGSAASVATIAAIVVLFPALASVMYGLAQASQQSLDLIEVYGGGRWQQLLKVTLPNAIPAIFAAARVSVPGAMTGALLAEWLSTGQGVGGYLVKYTSQGKWVDLWSCVALVTLVVIIVYNLVAVAERSVLQAMQMQPSRDR